MDTAVTPPEAEGPSHAPDDIRRSVATDAFIALSPTATCPLTEQMLVANRWRMGINGRGELTGSFYFGADGQIKVFKSFNEASWKLIDGVLHIYDFQGGLAWVFDLSFRLAGSDGQPQQLMLVGGYRKEADQPGITLYLLQHKQLSSASLLSAAANDEEAAKGDGPEQVRLVIWDLDDTFWRGTLSEGRIDFDVRNTAIVETLNKRGIVNSICSKNDRSMVEACLREAGLWELFVFPEIAFAPKGAMVARIIKNIQLRAPSVLFIDDNVTNLNEALFYSPGLQIAEPSVIDGLLDDPRFAGKPDPDQRRLQQYRVLEKKIADIAAMASAGSGADNIGFLRNSDIRVSFHTDVEGHFKRIHDLVNRTNQLNFTKRRWPEDPDAALNQFKRDLDAHFLTECGVVKVADRYGAYGICGFYLVSNRACTHLLFSCRSMNMGVEQFVWNQLGRPYVHIQGEVISDIDAAVDWIRIVNDADDLSAEAPKGPDLAGVKLATLSVFGACNLSMMTPFLRRRFSVREEFNYPFEDWGIFPLPRIIASATEAATPANRQILERLPGMPRSRYESDLLDGSADAYVLSFSSESFCAYYRAESTGLIIPMVTDRIGPVDFKSLTYEDVLGRGVVGVSREQWVFMQEEFEFLGKFDPERFSEDVTKTLSLVKAHGKPVVLIALNDSVGRDKAIMQLFGQVNSIANPIAASMNIPVVTMQGYVRSEDDLAPDGHFVGSHFQRQVYAKIAEEVVNILS